MTAPAPGPSAAVRPVLAALATRPWLWATAVTAVLRLAAPGWWRRRPHLPLPDPALWSFRMVTAYGRPDAVPPAADIVGYLEWCRSTARPHHGRMADDPSHGR